MEAVGADWLNAFEPIVVKNNDTCFFFILI